MLKFKILLTFILLHIGNTTYVNAQSLEKELVKADSLYQKKQYLSAIKIYEKIYQEGNCSPAMLLKLARIEEGMDNLGTTLYYLEKYYRLTKDEKALQYLKQTTEKIDAKGFAYEFAFHADLFYKEWKIYFQLCFMIIAFFTVGMMIKNKESVTKKRNYFSLSLAAFVLLAILANYSGKNEAIIVKTPSYLLEGPSAGANLIDKLSAPAKIELIDQLDVWNEVMIEEKKAFIKNSEIKKL